MTEHELAILSRALTRVMRDAVRDAVGPLEVRMAAVAAGAEAAVAALQVRMLEDAGGLRERLAVVEARTPEPGPPGPPGPPGADGKDGAPGMRYLGVYVDGKAYGLGDGVTYQGSLWHCNEETSTRPGDGQKAWTLAVKRGRDGKGV